MLALMPILNVSEAPFRLDELAGRDLSVFGILHFLFEDIVIYKVYTLGQQAHSEAAIWLYIGKGSFSFDESVCSKLNSKIVLVQGRLRKPALHLGGCGHMNAFPANLIARTLETYEA